MRGWLDVLKTGKFFDQLFKFFYVLHENLHNTYISNYYSNYSAFQLDSAYAASHCGFSPYGFTKMYSLMQVWFIHSL